MKNKIFRVVLGAIIIKGNKVLLLKRSESEKIYPGIWELPSGKREFGEKSNEAIMREVKEETGLDITLEKPSSVFEYTVEKPDEIRDTTQINFIANLNDPNQAVTISEEHEEASWFTLEDVKSSPKITEETKKVILDAFR